LNSRNLIIALAGATAISAGGYALYWLGTQHSMQTSSAPAALMSAAASTPGAQKAGDIDPASGKKVLYWHDPMVPGQNFDKPGKSPFMDMQLVPVYAESAADAGTLTIDPRVQQNLGVRTAEARQGTIDVAFQAVGSTAYNDRDVALVQARSNGFVERLYVRAPLDPVRKGQPLAELYVPDWVAAQEEYLSAKRISGQASDKTINSLVDAARQRMRLAGMSEAQILHVEASNGIEARITLTAPISGVVSELAAREGMTVMAGAPLFRINGLSTIWVNAEVPENQAALVRPGNVVEASTPALPDMTFKGKVSAILPEVNAATRTIKARVELANPGGRLVPGMFATVHFASSARKEIVLVPSEAVIQTGKRSVVIVAQGDGRFAPVDVDVGMESGGETEIRKGITAGQRGGASGQFLIDSEASIKGTVMRMEGAKSPDSPAAGATTHRGQGKVEAIDKDAITLSHGPIPTLQWSAMTMTFRLPSAAMARDIAVGDMVAFEIRPTADGGFEIASIRKNADAGGKAKGSVNGNAAGKISEAAR
jgi:membrane fusion protein, copper/silver efflux system